MDSNPNKILGKERLRFQNNEELKAYYERKYGGSGYTRGGHVVHGVNISALYHTRRQDTTDRLLAVRRVEVVLDAGCGDGALAAKLAPNCREIHAVDIAANALAPEHERIPNLRFQAMNIEALAYPDGFFDAIACVETLEHLLSPEKALTELARVLKPGGRFVLTYPTINRTRVKAWGLGRKVPISEHLNEWSYAEVVTALQAAGLTVGEVEGIAFDFGALLALKAVGRSFALGITRLSLAIRGAPSNSMFVAFRLTKK